MSMVPLKLLDQACIDCAIMNNEGPVMPSFAKHVSILLIIASV